MTLDATEKKQVEKLVAAFVRKHRPLPYLRPALDLSFRVSEQSVEIFEIRPGWHTPKEKIEIPIAKATYVKSRQCWRVLCQQRDLKWHRYQPRPEVQRIEEFFELVERDETGCFFG